MHRRQGPTLAERSGLSAPGPAPSAEPPTAPLPVPHRSRPVVTRHCWVSGLPDRPGRWAGLLVEWRQESGGRWAGRVAYVVADDAGSPVLVEAWLPAPHLSPG